MLQLVIFESCLYGAIEILCISSSQLLFKVLIYCSLSQFLLYDLKIKQHGFSEVIIKHIEKEGLLY